MKIQRNIWSKTEITQRTKANEDLSLQWANKNNKTIKSNDKIEVQQRSHTTSASELQIWSSKTNNIIIDAHINAQVLIERERESTREMKNDRPNSEENVSILSPLCETGRAYIKVKERNL